MIRSVVLALAAMVLACSGNGNGGKIAPPDGGEGDKVGGDNSGDACTPNCEGKECGDDGCGGECGQCSGLAVQCSDQGTCEPLHCESSNDCPFYLACEASSGQCVIPKCSEGAVMCDGDYVLTCLDGVEWYIGEVCAAGQYCEQGTCKDSCDPGRLWCEGDLVKWCQPDGRSKKTFQDCAKKGEHCVSGGCYNICTPGEEFCADDLTKAWCADWNSIGSQHCPALQGCVDGECVPWVCQPGKKMCKGPVALTCGGNGAGYATTEDCGAQGLQCLAGYCVGAECAPSLDFCADADTLGHCGADGVFWGIEKCGPKHSCQDGQCLPWVCVPGTDACEGSTPTTCDATGLGVDQGGWFDCQDYGKSCYAGKCVECVPNCSGLHCGGDDGCGGKCKCDDEDPCTMDYCMDGVCSHEEQSFYDCCSGDWECDDGDDCTAEFCSSTLCQYTTVPCCGDGWVADWEDCDDENEVASDGCDACAAGPPVSKTWVDSNTGECDPNLAGFLQKTGDLMPADWIAVKIKASQVKPAEGEGVGEFSLVTNWSFCVREWLDGLPDCHNNVDDKATCSVFGDDGNMYDLQCQTGGQTMLSIVRVDYGDGYSGTMLAVSVGGGNCDIAIAKTSEVATYCTQADKVACAGGMAGDSLSFEWWYPQKSEK